MEIKQGNRPVIHDMKTRLKVFRTRSGKGFWICPLDGQRHQDIQAALIHEIRNLIWNEYRLCWVLPRREGEQFYHHYFDDEQNQRLEEENGNIEQFPRGSHGFIPQAQAQEQKVNVEHKVNERQRREKLFQDLDNFKRDLQLLLQ